MVEVGTAHLAQQDGNVPSTLATGSAPGESGVSVLGLLRFEGGMHVIAQPRCHCVCFQISPGRSEKRIAGRVLCVERPVGSLTINPAGFDFTADADQGMDILVVAVDPSRVALAAAEGTSPDARLIERMADDDPALFALARSLAFESRYNYPNGPLGWNEVASRFIDGLVARHTTTRPPASHGTLGKDQIRRLRDYVMAHLDEPVGVEALADIAGRSAFHFVRVFTRSVGMTPHRYVVHLRLQRAIELIREGQSGFAEIAARTGFADQSHLTRWVRRVHGVPPSRFTA